MTYHRLVPAHRRFMARALIVLAGCSSPRGRPAPVPAPPPRADANSTQRQAPESPLARVLRQVDAFNRHDLDAFMATYASDVEVRSLGARDTVSIRGAEALRASTATLFRNFPGRHVDVLVQAEAGAYVTLHERATNAAGKAGFTSIYVYEVRDGLIARVWNTTPVRGNGPAAEARSGADSERSPASDSTSVREVALRFLAVFDSLQWEPFRAPNPASR